MSTKKINDNMVENMLGDFENTIMWMSARQWMWTPSDTVQDFEPSYPLKLVKRYWSGLSHNQKERLILDCSREIDYDWSDTKNRTKKLLDTYKEANEVFDEDVPFIPYPKCDEFEFSLIRLAVIYACKRQTIASASLPPSIIKNRYKYMSEEQKNIIANDLKEYLNFKDNNYMSMRFGNEKIDDKPWQKFLGAMDITRHFNLKIKQDDGTVKEMVCFKCNVINGKWNFNLNINEFSSEDVIYPLNEYLEYPDHEFYVPNNFIVE